MPGKKSYNRFFIIFQEEDKGYGMGSDKPPTGYVKVETKNDKSKVTVYVQNLKPFETGECLYRCYLISHRDNKDNVAYLGIMNIDDMGRGETSWESNADDVFNSKLSIDKYNAAAIIADKEGADKIISPLAGYMSKEKFEWRSKIYLEKHKTPLVNKETAQVKVEEKAVIVENKFEEYEKKVTEAVKENIIIEPVIEEINQVIEETIKEKRSDIEENVKSNIPMMEEIMKSYDFESEVLRRVQNCDEINMGFAKNEEKYENVFGEEQEETVRDKKEKHEKKMQEKCEDLGHDHDHKHDHGCEDYNYAGGCKYSYRCMLKKTLEDILEDYEEMGKHKDMNDCRMWKIDMKKYMRDGRYMFKFPCYDIIYYLMMNNPYCNYSYYLKKHKHYMFGIKYGKCKEVKAIIFGIPGKNTVYDQPYQGKTGFMKWISSGKDDLGYWIMMYDPMTGEVLIPQK